MTTGIVVGVDGSPEALTALGWALREGARRGQPVTAVTAWAPPVLPDMPAAVALLETPELWQQGARDVVRRAVDDVRAELPDGAELQVATATPRGAAGPALVELSRDADLLVVGDRGQGGLSRVLLGSTTSYVLHHARPPVAVLRAGAPPEPTRVVVGVDCSAASRRPLRCAAEQAERRGLPLVVVHAWLLTTVPQPERPDGYVPPLSAWHDSAQRQLQSWLREELGDTGGLQVQLETPHGPPARQLLELVHPDDLLVLGSRGHGGFRELLLGSVSRECAEHAPCPVLVVRAEHSG